MPLLLNDVENEAAGEFMQDHYRRCNMQTSKVELVAESTGIALAIKVKCPKCKATSDITDYSCW